MRLFSPPATASQMGNKEKLAASLVFQSER